MTVRLRHLAEINPPIPGWEQIPDDRLLTFVPLDAVWPRQIDFTQERPKSQTSTGYTRFMNGDVIVPKITPTFEADRSTWVNGSPTDVLTGTTELHVVRPSPRLEPRYLDHVFSSHPFLQDGASQMVGVAGQKRISDEWLRNYRVPMIGLETQRKIADYLDTETARIDALICKKRRMLDVLAERRGAVIIAAMSSALTTMGYDNRLRERRPLRAYAEIGLGRQRAPHYSTGPNMTAYLRAANVQDGRLDLSDVKSMNFDPSEQARFSLRAGDVLISEGSGSLASIGATAVWNSEIDGIVCFQNTLLRLRPRPSTDHRFLAWWCRYAYASGLFESMATGANIYHLSADRIRSLPMAHVPLATQRTIADHLDTEIGRIEATIDNERRVLDLLAERRQALIASFVTGEMPVPGPRT